LDFGTFICGLCASIHRELGFKVKAINLSKFSPEEIDSIKGNGVIKSTYFAKWDSRNEPIPPVTNKEELKQFISNAFVLKKWHPATQPQYNIISHQPQPSPYYQPIPMNRPDIPLSYETPIQKNTEGGFSVKTYESASTSSIPPYFDLSQPSSHALPESPRNLLADFGYQPPAQLQQSQQYPTAIDPVRPSYDQKTPKSEPTTPASSFFPFYQQPQRPPPRPIQPAVTPQIPPTPVQQPAASVSMPPTQPQISGPPVYLGQMPQVSGPQIPVSMHGGYLQYGSPSVVYPVSIPQNQISQTPTMVYSGATGGGYVVVPSGPAINTVMAVPQGNKGNVVVLPNYPPNAVQVVQPKVYVQNTMHQQQPQYIPFNSIDSGYKDEQQKKKQIEEDEALARILQEDENKLAH